MRPHYRRLEAPAFAGPDQARLQPAAIAHALARPFLPARADALADRAHVMQADLATAEAEGDALTIETAELTVQVKAAKAEAREAQDRAAELRQADAARERPESGGITQLLLTAALRWRLAQTGGRIPSQARRCRPHTEPAAAGRRLVETIASVGPCSSAD